MDRLTERAFEEMLDIIKINIENIKKLNDKVKKLETKVSTLMEINKIEQ